MCSRQIKALVEGHEHQGRVHSQFGSDSNTHTQGRIQDGFKYGALNHFYN